MGTSWAPAEHPGFEVGFMPDAANSQFGPLALASVCLEACTRPPGAPGTPRPVFYDFAAARAAWVRARRSGASASELRAAELAWVAEKALSDERCATFFVALERRGESLGQTRARLRRRTADVE